MATERLSGSEIMAWARAEEVHATLAANASISSDEMDETMQTIQDKRATNVRSALLSTLEERRQEFADEAAVAQMIVADIDGLISTVTGAERALNTQQVTHTHWHSQSLVFRYGNESERSGIFDLAYSVNETHKRKKPSIRAIAYAIGRACNFGIQGESPVQTGGISDDLVSIYPDGITLHDPDADLANSQVLGRIDGVGRVRARALSELARHAAQVSGRPVQ